jgi:two-component sensor histidine kinase
MKLSPEAIALLEAFPEPTLLGAPDGTIIHGNRAAKALTGNSLNGQHLYSLHMGEASSLQAYLNRCLGSGQPIVGALLLQLDSGLERFQCRGSLVSTSDERAILLRLSRADEDRFVALTRKVDELAKELGERQRTKALLQESLRERELLLRELQHRVKNNMHMLAAMLSGAEREATSIEAKAALKDASMRFSAVSAVQQLLYSSERLETIGSTELVSTLVAGARSIGTGDLQTELQVDPIDLPVDSALPIALILNELLTNAVKYGRPVDGAQRILVSFKAREDKINMVVHDNGPGFDLAECRKRASGLGLVRGLLRQLSGSLTVTATSGSCCVASFPDPQSRVKSDRRAA